MKNFRKKANSYFSKITLKYDLDMNLIEGVTHKEFNPKKIFVKPDFETYHYYHIKR